MHACCARESEPYLALPELELEQYRLLFFVYIEPVPGGVGEHRGRAELCNRVCRGAQSRANKRGDNVRDVQGTVSHGDSNADGRGERGNG